MLQDGQSQKTFHDYSGYLNGYQVATIHSETDTATDADHKRFFTHILWH